MNNVLKNPTGIDTVLQKIQTHLYNSLGWTPIDSYGRIYKNPKDNGKKVPQTYDGCGEYIGDVFIKDGASKGSIFFIVGDKHDLVHTSTFKVEVKVVFMLNLKNIYEDDKHRLDAKAQEHSWNILKRKNQFTVKHLETGLEKVLKEFDIETIKKKDIEPLHIFAWVGDLKYNINNC